MCCDIFWFWFPWKSVMLSLFPCGIATWAAFFVKCCTLFLPFNWLFFFLLICGQYWYIMGTCIANIFCGFSFDKQKFLSLSVVVIFFPYMVDVFVTCLRNIFPTLKSWRYVLKVLEVSFFSRLNRTLSPLLTWNWCLCLVGGRNSILFLSKLSQHHRLKRPSPPLCSDSAVCLSLT